MHLRELFIDGNQGNKAFEVFQARKVSSLSLFPSVDVFFGRIAADRLDDWDSKALPHSKNKNACPISR
jgi:hypothetical protein